MRRGLGGGRARLCLGRGGIDRRLGEWAGQRGMIMRSMERNLMWKFDRSEYGKFDGVRVPGLLEIAGYEVVKMNLKILASSRSVTFTLLSISVKSGLST
jgi:hypothetical protein